MAKLVCWHKRRVLVLPNENKRNTVLHRSDGTRCNTDSVAIASKKYDPDKIESFTVDPLEGSAEKKLLTEIFASKEGS